MGYTDLANGIPINLHPIAEADLGGVVFGLPIGGYLQGGATHHRTGGFVQALYDVGMTAEGDRVLEALASTVADDSSFGGIGSGLGLAALGRHAQRLRGAAGGGLRVPGGGRGALRHADRLIARMPGRRIRRPIAGWSRIALERDGRSTPHQRPELTCPHSPEDP